MTVCVSRMSGPFLIMMRVDRGGIVLLISQLCNFSGIKCFPSFQFLLTFALHRNSRKLTVHQLGAKLRCNIMSNKLIVPRPAEGCGQHFTSVLIHCCCVYLLTSSCCSASSSLLYTCAMFLQVSFFFLLLFSTTHTHTQKGGGGGKIQVSALLASFLCGPLCRVYLVVSRYLPAFALQGTHD